MPNRLAAETSPYLRQHADNPVDWWAWSEPALAAARAQDKPILLSIGYSACHWCHVMAHESFEDATSAAVMNDLYINIKVDREERPDLDKIYQIAHQALTRRGGGWPLTVFLTPDDHLPFYAGTYFPKQPRYGMPPFQQVLQQVRNYWDQRRDDVRSQNAALSEFLADYGSSASATAALTAAPIRTALEQSEHSFDPIHGGHAGAPKFWFCHKNFRYGFAPLELACSRMETTVRACVKPVSGVVLFLMQSMKCSVSTRNGSVNFTCGSKISPLR